MTMTITQQQQQQATDDVLMMQRPIHRLPVRKLSNDSKEAMNCKSCRKRKIKCNRLKPSCEACRVFDCPCVYDAIPKKRGPKTDVLEALLQRVNGLEKRLQDEQQKSTALESHNRPKGRPESMAEPDAGISIGISTRPNMPPLPLPLPLPPPLLPVESATEAAGFNEALLDTYFARLHNKPFYILDESATRLRRREGRLPSFLVNALYAVTINYLPHLCGGPQGARQSSQAHMDRARSQIDVDEASVEKVQALLLLANANFDNGQGRKSQMVLNHAIGMAIALSLHVELPSELRIAAPEREGRRKLFWTCYLMDRFSATGSPRPPLIADDAVSLRLPAWQPPGSRALAEGNYFPRASSLSNTAAVSHAAQGSATMLIEIVRILGVMNRYLAAGGVKGDSHFPWHAQSTLSRIRSDLDAWAAATQEVFTSVDALFGSLDSSTLVLSKLIYHAIHCLLYRPFLPIDLSELSGTGQSQSWQTEATHLCFLHANAIGDLCQIACQSTALLDWPSFVGYCVCTAGTVHIHGAHYLSYSPTGTYRQSAEYLARGMSHLLELRSVCAGLQHHRDTLAAVFSSHADLVKSLSSNPMRFSPTFQLMDDFFDRYPGSCIDGAHVTFSDMVILDQVQQHVVPVYNRFEQACEFWMGQSLPPQQQQQQQQQKHPAQDRSLQQIFRKRRRATTTTTTSVLPYPTPRPDQPSAQVSVVDEEAPTPAYFPRGEEEEEEEGKEETSSFNAPGQSLEAFLAGFSPTTFNFTASPIESAANGSPPAGQSEAFHCLNDMPELQTLSAVSGPAEAEKEGGEEEDDDDDDPLLCLLGQLAENDS